MTDQDADTERRWLITTRFHSEWQRSPWPLSYKDAPAEAWCEFFELGDRVMRPWATNRPESEVTS